MGQYFDWSWIPAHKDANHINVHGPFEDLVDGCVAHKRLFFRSVCLINSSQRVNNWIDTVEILTLLEKWKSWSSFDYLINWIKLNLAHIQKQRQGIAGPIKLWFLCPLMWHTTRDINHEPLQKRHCQGFFFGKPRVFSWNSCTYGSKGDDLKQEINFPGH